MYWQLKHIFFKYNRLPVHYTAKTDYNTKRIYQQDKTFIKMCFKYKRFKNSVIKENWLENNY